MDVCACLRVGCAHRFRQGGRNESVRSQQAWRTPLRWSRGAVDAQRNAYGRLQRLDMFGLAVGRLCRLCRLPCWWSLDTWREVPKIASRHAERNTKKRSTSSAVRTEAFGPTFGAIGSRGNQLQ